MIFGTQYLYHYQWTPWIVLYFKLNAFWKLYDILWNSFVINILCTGQRKFRYLPNHGGYGFWFPSDYQKRNYTLPRTLDNNQTKTLATPLLSLEDDYLPVWEVITLTKLGMKVSYQMIGKHYVHHCFSYRHSYFT